MRISDADRRRAVEELAQHLAAGRLDLDGYSERVEEVLAAQTLADVDHARRDLPFLRVLERSGVTGNLAAGRWQVPFPSLRQPVLVVALALVLVGAIVVIALTAPAALIALLLLGWVIGMVQGRAIRSRR